MVKLLACISTPRSSSVVTGESNTLRYISQPGAESGAVKLTARCKRYTARYRPLMGRLQRCERVIVVKVPRDCLVCVISAMSIVDKDGFR